MASHVGVSRRLLRVCTVDGGVQDGTLDNLVKDVASACKPGHKRCNLCSEEKAVDDFSTTSKGRSSYCTSCERLVRRGHNKGLQMETMRTAFKDGTIHAVRHQAYVTRRHLYRRLSSHLRDEHRSCHGFAGTHLWRILTSTTELANSPRTGMPVPSSRHAQATPAGSWVFFTGLNHGSLACPAEVCACEQHGSRRPYVTRTKVDCVCACIFTLLVGCKRPCDYTENASVGIGHGPIPDDSAGGMPVVNQTPLRPHGTR